MRGLSRACGLISLLWYLTMLVSMGPISFRSRGQVEESEGLNPSNAELIVRSRRDDRRTNWNYQAKPDKSADKLGVTPAAQRSISRRQEKLVYVVDADSLRS